MRFAVIGADHAHIFDHVGGLVAAGCEFAGFTADTSVPHLVAELRSRFPDVPSRPQDALLEDCSVDIICTAAIPVDRAAIAVDAMRHGKDVIADKPGCIDEDQLETLRRTVGETGRIWSVCFSERLCVRAAERASALVAAGAIGRVVQTLGVGPHRLNPATRPDWFFDPARNGGILVDIASHQIDQFLWYTGSETGEVISSSVGNYATASNPAFEDFGQILMRSVHANGYVRVDWFTPDGLPTWGDGRLLILGTEGYLELRKYLDIEGRPGGEHLFLADGNGTRHIDCSGERLTYFEAFMADVRDRTETSMTQDHVFETMRLALDAQRRALRDHMDAHRR